MCKRIPFSHRIPGLLGAGLGGEESRCRRRRVSAAGMHSGEQEMAGRNAGTV